MEKRAVMMQIQLEDVMAIEIAEYEEKLAQYEGWDRFREARWLKAEAIEEVVNKMTGEEIKQLLTASVLKLTLYKSLGEVVKLAIDEFDPYALTYDEPDEYKEISARITDDIDIHMTAEEIAKVIADEFNFTFVPDFTIENCMRPAKKIHHYLNTK